MVFDAIGGGLSAVGAVAGALGGEDQKIASAPQSGYATYDPEIKDYLMESIFPRIRAWGDTPFQTVPMRRANAEDYDPIFGSPSRQWLQKYYDTQELSKRIGQQQGAQAGGGDAAAVDNLRNEMLARDYINKLNYNAVNPSLYSQEDLAQMGEMLGRGGYRQGQDIPFSGVNFTPEDSTKFFTMFNAPRRG